ncbi:MAG: hypothetical protein Q8R60_11190 [Mycobacteriales bacterium]|nr:hypothetical protein [Mycobacteriales bacterium]
MTSESLPTCAQCGRRQERLFPRAELGQVCAHCYESLSRLRPEWSRLEYLGTAGLLAGFALVVVAVVALLVR